jgi:hypothetical protein
MAEALSKLMIFREIQKDMDVKGPTVFKGTEYGCDRNCVDFRDCCGSGNGWGVSLGLAGCSEKEKARVRKRNVSMWEHIVRRKHRLLAASVRNPISVALTPGWHASSMNRAGRN